MDDLNLRHELNQYVESGEPPLAITADETVVAGRRSARRRAVATGVAAVASAAALFSVVALPVLMKDTTTPVRSAESAAASASQTVAPEKKSVTGCRLDGALQAHYEKFFECYLTTRLTQIKPGTTLKVDKVFWPKRDRLVVGYGEGFAGVDATDTKISDKGAPGSFTFHAYPLDKYRQWDELLKKQALDPNSPIEGMSPADQIKAIEAAGPPAAVCPPSLPAHLHCRTMTGPHGETMMLTTNTTVPELPGYDVMVIHGNTVMTASLDSQDHSQQTEEPTRSTTVLSVDQLIALLTAPELDAY